MKFGMNKETIGSVVAVALVALGGWYAFTSGNLGGQGGPAAVGAAGAVALVNGEEVSRSTFDAAKAQISAQQGSSATTTELEKLALDSTIGRVLLLQAARQAGLSASTTAVEAEIQAAKEQLGGQEAYDKQLVTLGMTEEGLRTQIRENLAIQAYLEKALSLSALTATDAEIKTAYDQVVAGQSGAPALSEVKEQVRQLVIGQKQQQLITGEVEKLRAVADIKILI